MFTADQQRTFLGWFFILFGAILNVLVPAHGQIFEICPGQSRLITNRFGRPTRCLPHRTDLCSRDAPAPPNTCCYRSYGDYFCCGGVPPELCPRYENVTSVIYKQLYADGTRLFPFRTSLMNKRFGEYNNIIRNGDIFDSVDMTPMYNGQPHNAPMNFQRNPYLSTGITVPNGPPGIVPSNGRFVAEIEPPRKRCERPKEHLEVTPPPMRPSAAMVNESTTVKSTEQGATAEEPTPSEVALGIQGTFESMTSPTATPSSEDKWTTDITPITRVTSPMEWTTIELHPRMEETPTGQPTSTTGSLQEEPFIRRTTEKPALSRAAVPNGREMLTEGPPKQEEVTREYANRYDNKRLQLQRQAYGSWLSRPPAVQRLPTTTPTVNLDLKPGSQVAPPKSPPYKGGSPPGPPGANPPEHFRTIYDKTTAPLKKQRIPKHSIKPSQLMRRNASVRERERRSGSSPSIFSFALPEAYHHNVRPTVAIGNARSRRQLPPMFNA